MISTSRNLEKDKAAMTLLELTVAILVLLTLVSILFIGARAWKKGSDRSANIMNVRNIQQAVRGHQNMMEKTATDTLNSAILFGSSGYLNEPKPPVSSVNSYAYSSTYGDIGVLYVTNSTLGGADGEYFYPAAELITRTFDW